MDNGSRLGAPSINGEVHLSLPRWISLEDTILQRDPRQILSLNETLVTARGGDENRSVLEPQAHVTVGGGGEIAGVQPPANLHYGLFRIVHKNVP